jgi:tetratricopeptide (TPR) repeat protein
MKTEVKIKKLIFLAVMLLPVLVFAQTMEDAQEAYKAAVAADQAGNTEEAIEQFNKCIEACEYLVEEEEDEKAEELLNSVQPIVPKLYLSLGTGQIKEGESEKGLENLQKAKETAGYAGDQQTIDKVDKIIPQVYYKIGTSKYKSEDLDGAIVELDKAIAANADYVAAYYLKAFIYKKKDDDVAFKDVALSGIAAAKRTNDTKMQGKIKDLGLKHFLKKGNNAKGSAKYDDAVNYLKSALEFDEKDGTTLYLLTSTYSSKGDYSAAIETGNKAVEVETGGAEAKAKIYLVIAEAHAKKGNNSAACAAYKKASVGQYEEHAQYQIKHVLKCQ